MIGYASAAWWCLIAPAGAVELKDSAKKAFDEYVARMESSMNSALNSGHVLDRIPGARARIDKREVVAVPFAERKAGGESRVSVPDGLINHWFGAMFIPNATAQDVRAVMEDYPNYSRIYAPDVAESKLLARNGAEFEVFLRLFRQVRIKVLLGYGFPVEFNARYRIQYSNGNGTLRIRSVSTRIAQVRDPKKSHTDEYPPDDGDGYLWRLNSYWRAYEGMSQGVKGVIVESEAISLSCSVPGFVEHMVAYFTSNFPRESMEATLRKTRDAVEARKKH